MHWSYKFYLKVKENYGDEFCLHHVMYSPSFSHMNR
jgi:hypothetical protein